MSMTNAKQKRLMNDATEWLVRLQSPALTKEQESAFFAWLDSSPAHQAAYIKAEQVWQRSAVAAKIPASELVSRGHSWFDFGQWHYAIAAGVLSVAIGIGFYTQMSGPNITVERYQTMVGEQKKIRLADGSTLMLNTKTSIKVEYSDEYRKVFLDHGEAYFDIRSLPENPFDVVTEQGIVRVLGTRFSVLNTENDTLVTVLKGKVGLDSGEDAQFDAEATLTANQQLSLEEASNNQPPRDVDAQATLRWRSGNIVFRGEPLQQVIDELNRYFDEQVQLGDSELSSREVVAVIQISNFESAIKTLEQSLSLQAETSQTGLVVLKKKPN